jgi:hypothetical protein
MPCGHRFHEKCLLQALLRLRLRLRLRLMVRVRVRVNRLGRLS